MLPIMRVSQRGRRLIERFEGLRLDAYRDIAGVWTIGYGHTGPAAKPGAHITKERAQELLEIDLDRFERCVQRAITAPMNQNQFDAFVAFAYNIGCAAFTRSTAVLRFNDGDAPEPVVAAWGWWVRAGGRRVEGLVKRRRAEIDLFLTAV